MIYYNAKVYNGDEHELTEGAKKTIDMIKRQIRGA